jgi:transformer-2 protein
MTAEYSERPVSPQYRRARGPRDYSPSARRMSPSHRARSPPFRRSDYVSPARGDRLERSPYRRSPPRREYRRPHSPVRGRFNSPPGQRHRSPPPEVKALRENPEPSNVLGVFGLSTDTTEDTIAATFSKFGSVSNVCLVMDRFTHKSRGFGFITFSNVEDAEAAREATNGVEIEGRIIRVDFSVTKGPHASTPGRYAGEFRARREGLGVGGGAVPPFGRYPREEKEGGRYPREERRQVGKERDFYRDERDYYNAKYHERNNERRERSPRRF